MRILFVADGRSPIALNWIAHFVQAGHEVHLISTFPCRPELPLASLQTLPIAFTQAVGAPARRATDASSFMALVPVGLRTKLRQWLTPLRLAGAGRRLEQIIASLQPDVTHALRIPYEGMLAALALSGERLAATHPLLILSVWGNDFTLHAPANPLLAHLTRRALARADALLADCRRDLRLALDWGFAASRPTAVFPGGGGVPLDVFYPPEEQPADQPPVVINPRGLRAYVQNRAFFEAIPLVLQRYPSARFVCPAMAGDAQVRRWAAEFGVSASVELLPPQSRIQMAQLFRRAQVAVSPTTHDGTPNTLLEAMACGCFPVAGDLESLREWITPGENGLLVNPRQPRALAQAILTALDDPSLRRRAREHNLRLVAARADYRQVMAQAEAFYRSLVLIPG